MTFAYRNPMVLQNGNIDCEINHPVFGWIPFTASPDDSDDNGRDLFAVLDALPSSKKSYRPGKSDDELAEEIRTERNRLLTGLVDPLAGNALRWADLTAPQQSDLETYRRALLNIPEQPGFPRDVVWPVAPGWIT